jgi:hypothetical protein
MALLQSHEIQTSEAVNNPQWAMVACRFREHLVDSCLCMVLERGVNDTHFFKILYQSQQPYYVGVALRQEQGKGKP